MTLPSVAVAVTLKVKFTLLLKGGVIVSGVDVLKLEIVTEPLVIVCSTPP